MVCWPLSGTTAADPSYPGAHSTISAAGADVLAGFYGNDNAFSVSSPALQGVTRSFTSFSAAAEEAGLSRIFSGQHTRLDHIAGLALGAAALRRSLESQLFGVSASDPVVLATVTIVLAAVAVLACALPARRVTRIDPIIALAE